MRIEGRPILTHHDTPTFATLRRGRHPHPGDPVARAVRRGRGTGPAARPSGGQRLARVSAARRRDLRSSPAKWRTDKVLVPVAAGKGLEYKLTMKKGEGLVYNVSYGALSDPKLMIVEFHGHTPAGQWRRRPDVLLENRRRLPRAACSPPPGTASTAGISRTTARRTSSRSWSLRASTRSKSRVRVQADPTPAAESRGARRGARTGCLRAADPTRSASSTTVRSSGDRHAVRRRSARGTPDRSRCR